MKDKRELLELAARACGYTLEKNYDAKGCYWPWCLEIKDRWDPTADDGDCARLEDAADLDIRRSSFGVQSVNQERGIGAFEYYADHNGNKGAARKWASTRAAAEVGRGMKP